MNRKQQLVEEIAKAAEAKEWDRVVELTDQLRVYEIPVNRNTGIDWRALDKRRGKKPI